MTASVSFNDGLAILQRPLGTEDVSCYHSPPAFGSNEGSFTLPPSNSIHVGIGRHTQYLDSEGPWSPLSVLQERLIEEPSTDQILFAPALQYPPIIVAESQQGQVLPTAPDTVHSNQLRNIDARYHNPPTRCTPSWEEIGSPPPDNPIGLPPKTAPHGDRPRERAPKAAASRGGRRNGLKPGQREKACFMRTYRACWWCAFMRDSVSFLNAGHWQPHAER